MTDAGRRELKEQILAAIGTHYAWMGELRACVKNGYTSLSPTDVAREDLCTIGTWLTVRISPELRGMTLYEESRRAHAAFHAHAARVVALTAEHSPNAESAIGPESEFSQAATRLRKTLSSWLALARDGEIPPLAGTASSRSEGLRS
jgi:hypothetical protein